MHTYTFKPTLKEVGVLQSRTESEIENEPMLFSADYHFALEHGGPITKEFVSQLDLSKNWIIDTRVHMLMEGWYPCIGGWHCDNIPRNTSNGQPNYKNPAFISTHRLAVVDMGTGSLTEFLKDPVLLKDPDDKNKVFGSWSKEINKQIAEGIISSQKIKSNKIVEFDALMFHRGCKATGKGWRFFIRATTDTPQHAHNKIRKQVNTYIEAEAGW